MTPVETVDVTTLPRKYPHVDAIADWQTQQTVRLLWDRVLGLEEQLTAARATIDRLVTSANTTEATASEALTKAKATLALGTQPGQAATSAPSGVTDIQPPGGGGATPPPGDGGDGLVGCAAAGSSGHDTGGLLNPVRAGQIVCGTGNEFSALKNPTASLATRQANATELLVRMVWHLQNAGFLAGRQRTPANTIAPDQLAVEVDGIVRAYQVFVAVDDFTTPLQTTMSETTPASLISDGGLPDS